MQIQIAKISFDPKNIWDRVDFREFLKSVNHDKKFEKIFYIVTEEPQNSDNTILINNIITLLDISPDNVYYVTTADQKKNKIQELGINFHFDGSDRMVNYLNANLQPIMDLFTSFYVNFIRDEYTQMMKYIERFRFELNIFLNDGKYNKND